MQYEKPEAEQICFAGKKDILKISGDNEVDVSDLLRGQNGISQLKNG